MKRFGMVWVCSAVCACSLVPDYVRPETPAPQAWNTPAPAPAESVEAKAWWERFGSPELARLVAQAEARNTDLQAALARIAQARAGARIAGAELWPAVDASAAFTRTHDNGGSGPGGTESGYRAGGAVAYEVDLWGRNRAGLRAAEARLQASAYDREALALVVSADVANAYFNLLGLRERVRIGGENLESARQLLAIVEARFREGAVSMLEVAQQRSAVTGAEAAQAGLARQLTAAENLLAVLVGMAPEGFTVAQEPWAELQVPAIAPAQPSALLARRPDILRAEANLIAANADIGAARAAYFPRLNLGANMALAASPASSAAALTDIFSASLAAPLFHGGALRGGVELAKARKQELVEQYRAAVLTAFREVEDALAATQAAQLRAAALAASAEEAQRAYALARLRYDAGAIDFQIVLDTQRSALQADDALVQAQLERLSAAVGLFKALGNGSGPQSE